MFLFVPFGTDDEDEQAIKPFLTLDNCQAGSISEFVKNYVLFAEKQGFEVIDFDIIDQKEVRICFPFVGMICFKRCDYLNFATN